MTSKNTHAVDSPVKTGAKLGAGFAAGSLLVSGLAKGCLFVVLSAIALTVAVGIVPVPLTV